MHTFEAYVKYLEGTVYCIKLIYYNILALFFINHTNVSLRDSIVSAEGTLWIGNGLAIITSFVTWRDGVGYGLMLCVLFV